MAIKIYVGASFDRYIELLLEKSGLQSSCMNEQELREIAAPNAPQPDAIILDVRNDSRIPDVVMQHQRNHPHTPLVMVAPAMDPTLMLEGIRFGVKAYVTEPLTRQELEAAIRNVVSNRPSPGTGPVYAFIGAKGGVGCTTLAVNTAAAINQMAETHPMRPMQEAGLSSLLIDLHVTYGDCAVFIGAEPKFSIVDALENTHRFDDAFFKGIVARTPDRPPLLASSDRLMATPLDPKRVQALIEFASYRYDHVVLDVSRSDSVVLDALTPVTTFAVVVSQELATVRSGRAIAAALRQRYGREKVQVVLNRRDSQAEITEDDVQDAIGEKIAFTFPSDYRAAVQAVNRGVPLVVEGHGKLPAALRQFASELAHVKAAAPSPVDARANLFARLRVRLRAHAGTTAGQALEVRS
jgi:pilus assembly protein CpaE